MKKFLLILFMVVDAVLIAGSAYVLVTYVNRKAHASFTKIPAVPRSVAKAPAAAPASAAAPPVTGNAAPAASAAGETTRRILFKYHKPKARQVAIRADFTGWKAEPMLKDANGFWTYTATLSPGEYAYCFTADDKTEKDPANKRTKQIGRTLVSAIVVEALPSKPAK
jgi:hypothetical protein